MAIRTTPRRSKTGWAVATAMAIPMAATAADMAVGMVDMAVADTAAGMADMDCAAGFSEEASAWGSVTAASGTAIRTASAIPMASAA
jgi:hypothetical protein